MASFIHSREGVTQGVQIAMVAYGIGILPLIKNLKVVFPDVTQPWYADNSGAFGTFQRFKSCFNSLKLHGQEQRYYPETSKRVMIIHPENLESVKLFDLSHEFKVFTGAHSLRVYIGDNESKWDWL